ncbi:hypothetical protein ACN2CC_05690 [Mesorhizobium muleiense]|uniref:hypothetical protein n=1 Tax=Mesorhizobium muleiense TaxID=1004279 RepID=UPI003AFA82EB
MLRVELSRLPGVRRTITSMAMRECRCVFVIGRQAREIDRAVMNDARWTRARRLRPTGTHASEAAVATLK